MDDFTCTFNSNGKSKAVEFFQAAFGNYCGTLPPTILTRKRGSSSSANPEIADKKGVRFIAIQEPNQDDVINVGLMKEYTGGDKIMARGLFKDPVVFKPQWKILLVCNDLPNIPSTDGGTWRRIRVSPFESEFVDVDEDGLRNGQELLEHQFPKDYYLNEKMEKCKKALLWLLINVYYPKYKKLKDSGRKIKEPAIVRKYTEEYKARSDIYLEFLRDNLIETKKKSDNINVQTCYETFKHWFKDSQSKFGCPKRREFTDYLKKNKYKMDKGFILYVKFNQRDKQEEYVDENNAFQEGLEDSF
jgi:phage/plasmid-associated DNA primase